MPLRNDRNGRSAVKDESQFRATVRRSNVIRSLVSLLSNSLSIDRREGELHFTVAPGYECGPETLTVGEEVDNLRTMPAADARAVEVFLDNNMLALLRTVFPVKSTNLRVDRTSKPQPHHVKMVQDLENKIAQLAA